MSDIKPRIKFDKKEAKKGELVEVKAWSSTSWKAASAVAQTAM